MESNLQIRYSESDLPVASIRVGASVFIKPGLMTIIESGDIKRIELRSTIHTMELYHRGNRISPCSTNCTIWSYEQEQKIQILFNGKGIMKTCFFAENTQLFTGVAAEANEEESKEQVGVTDQVEDEEQLHLQELVSEWEDGDKDEKEEEKHFESLSEYESQQFVSEETEAAQMEDTNKSIGGEFLNEIFNDIELLSEYESEYLESESEGEGEEKNEKDVGELVSELESELVSELESESEGEEKKLLSHHRRKAEVVEDVNEYTSGEFLSKRFKNCPELNNKSPTTIGTFSGSSMAYTPPYVMQDYSTNIFVGDLLLTDTEEDDLLLYEVIEIKVKTCTIQSYGTYEETEFKLEELSKSFKKVNIST
jgi:hypothetical protein